MNPRWVRSQRAAAVDLGGDLVLLGGDRRVRTLSGDHAELVRAILGLLATPRTADEVIAAVEAEAGTAGASEVCSQVLELLASTGTIVAAGSDFAGVHAERPAGGVHVVLAVTGAIAATHSPALAAALLRVGHEVEVALTQAAARFVSEQALAAITRRDPQASLWPRAAHAPVPHVALAEWADLVIVYPASATTIGRIANGDFSDLVSAIVLTTRAPVVIVPSMNADMLAAPAVQRNLAQLRDDGFAIVHGVPSEEAAEHPMVRTPLGGAAPAPGEVVATVERLRAAGVLRRRGASEPRTWDSAYRAALVPWASATCDPDLAAALAAHAPGPRRVLDVGCGLGQVACHAAATGHRVVATERSEVALAAARARAGDADIIWLRDDICASGLAGPFDIVIDRATLHALPRSRAAAWAAAVRRMLAPGGFVIVKCHRDGIAGVTTGWSGEMLGALMPELTVIADRDAELPGIVDATPIPSRLVVLHRER